MIRLFSALVLSAVIAYLMTPIARRAAYRLGAIDVPKDNRRMHLKPIPRMGGLAIYIAFMVVSLLMMEIDRQLITLLIGATLMAGMGMLDDTRSLPAKMKLLIQILAALIVIAGGVRIEFITNFLSASKPIIPLGWFSIPATVFWVVGITNTVNLIDGLDGLAAGVAGIASLSLAAVAYLNGQPEVAVLLMILAGASIGFLPHNSHPATIFMGDTGSLLIGFVLAAISIEGVIKSATTIAVAIPVLALGVPIFDTAFAILRRMVNKRPIMEADKGHLHHRLLDQGYSHRQTVWILYAFSFFLGVSAIFISGASRITSIAMLLMVTLVLMIAMIRAGLLKRMS
jgi:UDP-GlcNAc:undecaprenyl-phosphate/decaprenyl-phosphate GlcNAc-1-phosphate transferase